MKYFGKTVAACICLSTALVWAQDPPGHDKAKILNGVRVPGNERLLETDYKNPSYRTVGQNWASALCHNGEWMKTAEARYEWQPIFDPTSAAESQVVGISGIAADPHLSDAKEKGDATDGDVWFTHPFGNDSNVNVIWESNPNFDFLVAPRIKSDEEQDAMRIQALNSGLRDAHVLHVEMDSDFMPPAFRAKEGDSIVVFGRWIVDCGHDNFQTEIHPPLLFARGSGTDDALTTKSTIIGRPFLVTQEYEHGSLRDHLLKQIRDLAPLAAIPPPFNLAAVAGIQLTARTKILAKPFVGTHLMFYQIRPPLQQPPGTRLRVSYHFTVRTGVSVQLTDAADGKGTVTLAVLFDDLAYRPATLPPQKDWKVPLSDIKAHENLGPWIIGAEFGAVGLGNPAVPLVLEKGVTTDRYKLPVYPEPSDTTVFASALRNNTKVLVDDTQPFPIRGVITVSWVKDPQAVVPRPAVNPRATVHRPVVPQQLAPHPPR